MLWQRHSVNLVGQVSLSPDQTRLLVTGYRSDRDWNGVHVLDVASNQTTALDPRRANGREVDGRGEVEILGWVDDDRVLVSSTNSRTLVLSVMEVATGHRSELFAVSGDYLQASMGLMPPEYWWQFLAPADAPDVPDVPETAPPWISYPRGPAWTPLETLLTAYYDSNGRLPVAPISRAWRDGLRADFPADSGDGIVCDPATLAPYEYQSELLTPIRFTITHPDPDAVIACLEPANERFLAIDEHGDEWQEGVEPASDTAIMGWFHPTRHDATTVLIWLDAGGTGYPWMMRTLLHVLVAILAEAGITEAAIGSDTAPV